MTLPEVTKIDIVAKDKTGNILLVIVAVGDWKKDKDMLKQLNAKLSNYVAFIKGPNYKSEFGEAEASIQLRTLNEPTKEVKDFLNEVTSDTKIPIEIILQPLFG